MNLSSIILILTFFAGFTVVRSIFRNPAVFMYPFHASCNITWTFGGNCDQVKTSLTRQIQLWRSNDTCGVGQKCLYELSSSSVEENILKAVHMAPKTQSFYDLTFAFYPNRATKGCNVIGISTSRTWYAILDKGTNYCNLHNLVDGAGLRKDNLYSELTRDEICTQYTSANCDFY